MVAMVIYIFHILIIGKVEIGDSFSVSIGTFGFLLQKCLLSSSLNFKRLLSESLNLIGCQGEKRV